MRKTQPICLCCSVAPWVNGNPRHQLAASELKFWHWMELVQSPGGHTETPVFFFFLRGTIEDGLGTRAETTRPDFAAWAVARARNAAILLGRHLPCCWVHDSHLANRRDLRLSIGSFDLPLRCGGPVCAWGLASSCGYVGLSANFLFESAALRTDDEMGSGRVPKSPRNSELRGR